jgi:hypothetical protein
MRPSRQGCIKPIQLRNNDGPILCSFRIVLVVVLALVIGLLARVFDYDYEDDDEDDMKIALSTKHGTLAALAEPSLMQPCLAAPTPQN